ncbi:MAG: TonB-dependent receptor plug domain-containing protein [Verrucomicrobia bacterium]|nr:TonB-dependent receptor plug domain-containing protein [Verrucomicrobiota bacterium]
MTTPSRSASFRWPVRWAAWCCLLPGLSGAEAEKVVLSPFEVTASSFDTYEATNTNAITGTNTALGKTPLDAKVFNRQLMDEMGVVDMTQMLSLLGGLGAATISGGNEEVRGDMEGDRQDPKSMYMRGLQINNPRRDGFLRSDTSLMDSFDVERVEAIGGSNSLLFGSGDAGGVITSSSKRAVVGRPARGTLSAGADSEGSRRFAVDAGAGSKYWAFRVNAVHGDAKYFRPANRQVNEGLHLAATFRPWRRLEIRGEWRHLTRVTTYPNSGTVRAPLTWLLPTGERVDGQSTRYIAAFPNARELTGGLIDVTKADTLFGPYYAFAFKNKLKSIVAEASLTDNLALQLRYGHDARVNNALSPTNSTIFAPGSAGNLYVDPVTGQVGTQWAFTSGLPQLNPFHTGARGYRAAVVYQKSLGWLGRHQASAFLQDMQSWTNQEQWRYFETDASGKVIQNPALLQATDSGRINMPAIWLPVNTTQIIGGRKWPFSSVLHPNGKTYVAQPVIYPGAVPATPANPWGFSGPLNPATGASTVTGYYHEETIERSHGFSLFSEWWKGRIDTMAGYRAEEASYLRSTTGQKRGPITYDSLTAGAVIDTPVKGLRVSVNYSTNAKINFDTTRDIFNQPLPPGKGVSKDVGLKFGLWGDRVSGNLNYYVSEAQNFTATLGGTQNDIDPNGINGRNGGGAYTYSKTSDGYNLTLSARPLRGWEVRINFATANGSERSDVILPQFYNDQFNTTTVGGQAVVGVRATAGAAVTPLLVPSTPGDPASARIPLSLAMMKDPTSPYYAQLDLESGQILNAEALGLLTPGVGTLTTGLPITDHQLGFVSPSGGTLIVRRAGERTFGYAERSYSLINRFQFQEGRLRGLVVGLSSSLRENHRGYMYTDAADGNKRKMYYFPDRLLHDLFALYRLKPWGNVRTTLQVNVSNLLDANEVMYLVRSTNGTLRYAQWLNSPRKLAVTTTLSF